ncbi:MAG: 3'-5' exonuclease [Acidobacteriota bacterium]
MLAPEVERARAAVEGEGLLSFDDLLVRSRNLLRDHPAVRRREADALQAILVDEIQDTDPLQYEIVFMLAESAWVRPARDPWSVRLAPGRLFVVGDPKQSIFRFRGADVAAFDRALRVMEGQGADVLMLQSSFRSPRAILDPLDRLFAPWLGPKDELEREWSAAPSYHAIRAERAAPDPAFGCGPRIEIWSLPADLAAGARRVAEGRAIATHIAAAVSNGLRYEDHAILLAAFSDVAAYARALDRAGIPFTLEGGRTFYERPEVTDLLALLRALAEPNDRVALLSFLRSPVGAVPDAELLRHVESGGAIAVDGEPDPASLPALARSLGLYRRLARRISGVPVDEAVRAVIGETRLMEIHAAGFDGAQRVANLRKIEALAADLSRDRFLSLSGLVRDLEAREKSSGGEGEPALADEGLDAVRIVTVHRAKGLEFPVVFVADMARHDREGAQESHAGYTEREPGPGLAVRLLGAHVQSTLGALARGTEEVHRPAEHRRLLYVAATRARERLVLIAGSARGTRSSWVEALRSWGYDPRTPPRDGERLLGSRVLHRSIADDVTAPPRRAIAAPDLHAPAAAFLSAARSVRAVRRMGSPTALREEREAARSEEHALSRPVAFAIGLTVHAALEAMDFADPSPALAYGRVLALASRASDQHGVDPATVAPAAARILESFASGRLRARLAAARIVGREVPLIARNPDGRPEVMTGIADVVFEERGEIVVADWKTDLVGDDALVAAAVDRYRPQVAWYAEALSRSLDRPVAAELFFLTRDLGVRV